LNHETLKSEAFFKPIAEEENMPVVIVEMWEGRTIDQKKQLAKDITTSMENIGVPKEAVQIIIKDNPKHNWAIGGKLASEKA